MCGVGCGICRVSGGVCVCVGCRVWYIQGQWWSVCVCVCGV